MTTVECTSPCNFYCQYDPDKPVCLGCFRDQAEIKNWTHYTRTQQAAVMVIANQRLHAFAAINLMPANFDYHVER
jgi:predicted Fe-S protein YdhL (DUF1289 family)